MSRMILTYECNGRFGNNIIQFLATKLLSKKLGDALVLPPPAKGKDSTIIDDDTWQTYLTCDTPVFASRSLHLNAYYQRAKVFYKYREWIDQWWNDTSLFNQQMRYCDIFGFPPKTINPVTLVIHLRLDDFNFQDGKSNCVDPAFFITQVHKSNKTHAFIVVDRIRYQGEATYIQTIVKGCPNVSFTLQQGSLLDDWNMLRCAPYVISSNSSFAWTACFLGKIQDASKVVVYPLTHFYDSQDFAIDDWEGWRNEEATCIDFTKYYSTNMVS